MRTSRSSDGKACTVAMPERPCTRASQVEATSRPTGVTVPMPVTTTRRCPSCSEKVIAPVPGGQYSASVLPTCWLLSPDQLSFAHRLSTPARRVLSTGQTNPDTVTELTPRRERILRHVVQEYVALAQPVPSDLIARKYESDLSPATVRNELAALEEAGLIAQPHTSAGRVPTDRGYRYFVELLMQEDRELSSAERRTLRMQFNQMAAAGTESTHLGPSLLARTLRSAAVATRPAATHARV